MKVLMISTLLGVFSTSAFAEISLNCSASGIVQQNFKIKSNTVVNLRTGQVVTDPNNMANIDQMNGIYFTISSSKGQLTVFVDGNAQQDLAAIGEFGLHISSGGESVNCQ